MNRKRRSKICCLSGILLLILLLAGVQRVSAMTTRTELYQNTAVGWRKKRRERKQLLANSYAGNTRLIFLMDSKETIRMGITYRSCDNHK